MCVIARASPVQKESFIRFVQHREPALMCGDGTNDAGALRAASVGIALVGTAEEPTKEQKLQKKKAKEEAMRKALAERRMPRLDELNAMEEEAEFKLGDASIAAPFTNKHSNSIKCVVNILRQGLATLVSGIQSYKTSTLSSLMLAYSMSSLHLNNLKFSDFQYTAIGLYTTYLYYIISNGKPVRILPKDKPDTSIFSKYFWVSLIGQAAIHFYFMKVFLDFSTAYQPEETVDVNNEVEFVPTLMTTCMFLFELASCFCIWIFNYEGRPFMCSLSETAHWKLIAGSFILIPLLSLEAVQDLSTFFSLTFKSTHPAANTFVTTNLLAMLVLVFCWTRLIKYLKLGHLEKLI